MNQLLRGERDGRRLGGESFSRKKKFRLARRFINYSGYFSKKFAGT